MNRTIITVLITLVVLLGGSTVVLWFMYRDSIAPTEEKMVMLSNSLTGKAELMLAEEKVYQEYSKTYTNGPGTAKVLFRWFTTYQYMVNLSDPAFKIVKDGATIKVTCPPIKMNEPIIDISTYKAGLRIETSIWVDEYKKITEEMPNFKAKSLATGTELMKNPQIVKLCTDQLRLVVLEIVSSLQLQADKVEIEFLK